MKKAVKWVSGTLLTVAIMGVCAAEGVRCQKIIQSYRDQFYPGTVINGFSAEGKTAVEVWEKLQTLLSEQAQVVLSIKGDSFLESKTLEELGLHYEGTLEELEALQLQQEESSWLKKVWRIYHPQLESVQVAMSLSDQHIADWVSEIGQTHNQSKQEPTAQLTWKEDSWEIVIENGESGLNLEEAQLVKRIQSLPSLPWKVNQQVEATFEEDGEMTVSVTELKKITKPIGSWVSYFNPDESRAQNVKRAAELIHNTVVMPGETFSYNEHVLPATADNGYGYGIIFVNGEKVPGMAGGICQVSSTLYNAILEAGIKADSRQNHSLFVDYVPYGQDATMNDSGLDFTFTNPYDVPIIIQATTNSGRLTTALWSAPEVLKGIDYKAYTVKQSEKVYDTYLQSFDSSGKLLASDFLHRSTYR